MFKLKSLTAIVTLGVLSVSATQTEGGHGGHGDDRNGVYTCKDAYWKGLCTTFYGGQNECVNFSGGWNDAISSIRNNGRDWHCQWWEHAGCQGLVYQNQEDANLHDGNGLWGDRISSFRCGQ
ncbi:hypothetical protein QBC40DRAFT_89820 [Triangularia verruculosa]|uniref:Uncharacterized protein n=1 Tax=Triangularia verruculosa TaxID=2587418 RepID=A0AAN6XG36_9PEZI|nr:hypothetical protein QBC40DRAFT_89820 [Triangularia verruculosa]